MGNISAKNYTLTEEEKNFIKLKNVRILNCLPRHAKRSADIAVVVGRAVKGAKKIEVDIIINVPGKKELVSHASSDTLASAYEVAENKMKAQARKYKDDAGLRAGFIRRLFGKQ